MELVKNETHGNTLQVFNCELGQVRVIVENGEPLFCLSDLANSLELVNPTMVKTQVEDEFDTPLPKFNLDRVVGTKKDGTPAIQNAPYSFVTESQLYFVIMRSKSDKAKAFRQWICNEVLPSIRKTDIGIKDSSKYLPQEVNSNCINVDVKLFNFEMFDVETLFENSTPYFKLTDIENILGLTKGQSAKWIKDGWFDEDEVKLRISQLGGYPLKYVAESGLYRILNRTNSPKARPFERWVTKEVLPSLRKNGGYIAGQENMTPEQIVANALIVAQNIIADRDKTIAEQKQIIEYQGDKLENFTSVEKARRSKQELATKLNKTIRKLAEQKFDKDYGKAYTYVYGEFAKLHCISDKVNMDYLKKNIDHLAECLAIATTELD